MKKRKFFRLLWAVFAAMMLLPLGTTAQSGRYIVMETSDKYNDYWDNAFFFVFDNYTVKEGDIMEWNFEVRADAQASSKTYFESQPGGLVSFRGFGDIDFTTEWATMEGRYECTSGDVGTQCIQFCLSVYESSNKYYFRNISVKINDKEVIKNGDLLTDDFSSFGFWNPDWNNREYQNVEANNGPANVDTPEPYAVLSPDGTLTFYYDGNKPDGAYGIFDFPKLDVKKVVFDASFYGYKPNSIQNWFADCKNLTEIVNMEKYLNTENVSTINGLFQNCISLETIDMSGFGKVKYGTSTYGMFLYCEKLQTIYVSDSWDERIYGSGWPYGSMFTGCYSLYGNAGTTYTDYDQNPTGYFARIDGGASAPGFFTRKDDERISVVSIELASTPETHYSLADVLYFDANDLISVKFSDNTTKNLCIVSSFVSGFDNMNVGAQTLKINYGGKYTTYGIEVTDNDDAYSLYNTQNNTLTMYYGKYQNGAFYVGKHLTYRIASEDDAPNIKKVTFDETFANYKPTNLRCWFIGMNQLSEIEHITEYLNTENVTNMEAMFMGCESLSSIDLSGFNTTKVTNMNGLFDACFNLKTIVVGDGWSTEALSNPRSIMFSECNNLVGSEGTAYTTRFLDATYARIDGGVDAPGYFTRKNVIVINNEQQGETVAEFFDNGVEAVVESPTKVDKVEVLREFEKDKPSTIILPIDMDVASNNGNNTYTNLMDGYEFYEFTGVEKVNGKWEATYKQVEKIEANKPYIVKNTGDKDLVFDNGNEQIDLKPVGKDETTITEGTDGTSAEGWEFVGTYEKKVWDADSPNEFGFAANDEGDDIKAGDFVRIGAGASIKPTRSYLRYTKNDNPFSKAGEQLPDKIGVILIPLGSVVNPDDPNNDPNNGDIETPVSEIVPATNSGAKVWSYDKTIVIEAAPSTAYQVIDLGGRTLKNGVTNTSREEIVLGGKTDGMVIVMIGGKSFKIKY